jgi:hypothetical protein
MTTVRTTCEGAMRTHTTPSLPSAGTVRGVAGFVYEGSVPMGSSEGGVFSLIVPLGLPHVLVSKVRHRLLTGGE